MSAPGPAVRAVGVHHVSLNVDDVPAALAFYVDVLGCSVRSDRPAFPFDGAWLDLGDQQIHLIAADVPADLGQHVAVLVADLDDAVAAVRSRGVEVSDPKPVGRSRQAFLRDPAGNRIELHQPG